MSKKLGEFLEKLMEVAELMQKIDGFYGKGSGEAQFIVERVNEMKKR